MHFDFRHLTVTVSPPCSVIRALVTTEIYHGYKGPVDVAQLWAVCGLVAVMAIAIGCISLA